MLDHRRVSSRTTPRCSASEFPTRSWCPPKKWSSKSSNNRFRETGLTGAGRIASVAQGRKPANSGRLGLHFVLAIVDTAQLPAAENSRISCLFQMRAYWIP